MTSQRATAFVEFAVTWPVVLLAVLASVQLGLWSDAAFAARAAALAGARAGSAAGGSPDAAYAVVAPALRTATVATPVRRWCPPGPEPVGVWVCARDTPEGFEVLVGGEAAAVAPMLPARRGLPVAADAILPYERFQ